MTFASKANTQLPQADFRVRASPNEAGVRIRRLIGDKRSMNLTETAELSICEPSL